MILIIILVVNSLRNNIKIGCVDSCCNKTCCVLTKSEEQEDLLITLSNVISLPRVLLESS
jgi:hypothetical protein